MREERDVVDGEQLLKLSTMATGKLAKHLGGDLESKDAPGEGICGMSKAVCMVQAG